MPSKVSVKLFCIAFFSLTFFFIFPILSSVSAQEYSRYYYIGGTSYNICLYQDACGAGAQVFNSNCGYIPEVGGGGAFNGDYCCKQIMNLNPNAICVESNTDPNTGQAYPYPEYTCPTGWGQYVGFYCEVSSIPTLPPPTPTSPPRGLIAEPQQCNISGTAWDTLTPNVCIAPGSCTVLPTCTDLGGVCTGSPPGCPAGSSIIPYSSDCSSDPWVCCTVPPTPTLTPTLTPTPIPGTVTIQGHHVNSLGADFPLAGQRVTVSGAGSTVSTPTWFFNTLFPNSYTVTANNIIGYSTSFSSCINCTNHTAYTSGNSVAVALPIAGNYADIFFKYTPNGTPIPTPTPTITPTPAPGPAIYSISGKLFNDVNTDTKSPGDSNYTGAVTITVNKSGINYPVANTGGNYTTVNLVSGQYTVTFSGLPAGFRFTYPFSSLIVRIGSACSVPITSEATCTLGNIINLNAGVTDTAQAWIQSAGSDLRVDSGFNDPLPSNSTYASVPGSGGMPGIIFSGALTPSFGLGQASSNPFNWQVGNPAEPDLFTTSHVLIPTSYNFIWETAQSSGINPGIITSLDGLTHGIYKVEGNLNLAGADYTFAPGNFIILINGDLNINRKIKVPVGSTAVFSARGDITVNSALGEPAGSSTPTIEGLYSADNNFIADAVLNNCPVSDLRLNVAGTIVANAGRRGSGNGFINRRDLCVGNAANPAVGFIERPDFLLNYPAMVKYIPRSWQEVAP